MRRVLVLKGLPGAGKTTWAKQRILDHPGVYKRVNKDDLRAMLDAGRWNAKDEIFVLRVRDLLILAALDAGKDVIVDDTNLHSRHERRIRRITQGRTEVEVEVVVFATPLDECIRRDRDRPQPVGEGVIRQMYAESLAGEAGPGRARRHPGPR